MTWFRCGGGGSGIPAALKNRMNAVLNKKFGTAVDYPPNGWPDDVNLMGLLEEKTAAAASICTFDDGADAVPIKSWEVEIAPTLTGKSAIECAVVDGEEYLYGSTIVQGGFNIKNGNNYASTNRLRTDNYIPVTSGSYTIENNQSYEYVVYVYDETNTFIDAESIKSWQPYGTSFSINGNRHIRISWRKSDNSTITADEITGYHCYAVGSKTVSTVNLGRTVHGGNATVTNGTGTEGYGIITFDGSNDENWQDYSSYNGYYIAIPTMKVGTRQDGDSNYLTNSQTSAHTQDTYWLGVNSNRLFLIEVYNMMGSSIEALRSYLSERPLTVVFPLATPTDFTFTPITPTPETALGVNNFWADTGDSEVTYRGQGTLTPVLPTLISKSITQNGTYSAEDDGADGYDEVTVNVLGGTCERLLYLRCVNNDQIEIPAASSITQGDKYSQYVSYDSTTKKFTVLQDFTAIIIAWVYTYQTYESSRSDGALYINNSQIIQYEANGTAAGSTGGVYLARNFKQNDTFNVYTPTRDGYPQQNLKIYLLADVPDSIYTFTDENA